MGELLATMEACDKELTELGKALKLVTRRSRPVVMHQIDFVLERRYQLGRRDSRRGSAASRSTLLH